MNVLDWLVLLGAVVGIAIGVLAIVVYRAIDGRFSASDVRRRLRAS